MDDNKIKLNLSEIESLDESGMNIPVNEDNVAHTVEKEAPAQVAEPTQQSVCIIDETSTTVTFGEETNVPLHDIFPATPSSAQAIKPQIKEKIKFSVVQIVFMAIVGLIALWTVFFTVDHTLAANGRSPIFCTQTRVYKDNSSSYKGLFYKVQFKFDSEGNLTQKVCPSWEDGPNDVAAENK